MQDENAFPVVTVEQPARWLDDLPVAGSLELCRTTADFRMFSQVFDVIDDTPDQLCRSDGILEGNEVRDGLEVG